jgi:hypothetical protein
MPSTIAVILITLAVLALGFLAGRALAESAGKAQSSPDDDEDGSSFYW